MALIEKEIIRKEIEFAKSVYSNPKRVVHGVADAFRQDGRAAMCDDIIKFLDTLPEQPVSDHHEIEVEFRGEKVTVSREFYRDGEMNYSTSAQDDNVIWAALRAWCEKKGITAFELYPKQPEQPASKELYEEVNRYYSDNFAYLTSDQPTLSIISNIARHFAEWTKNRMLIESSKKEVDEFMSKCDRDVLDELNRWRFTTACQEFIEQGIFDYGCAKHFAEWGAEQKSIEIFKKQNCQDCGTQRCTGDGEWLEGCKAFQAWKAEHLKK